MAKSDAKGSARPRKSLKSALDYAAEGFGVLLLYGIKDNGECTCGDKDCDSPGKHPVTRSGFKDATTDADRIRKLLERHPNANIGAVPGPDFVVVDIDPGKGGLDSLNEIEEEHGELPATLVAETGLHVVEGERVRGLHLWFRVPPGTGVRASRLAPGIDLRSDRGYVVMPPSLHASGVRYRWRD